MARRRRTEGNHLPQEAPALGTARRHLSPCAEQMLQDELQALSRGKPIESYPVERFFPLTYCFPAPFLSSHPLSPPLSTLQRSLMHSIRVKHPLSFRMDPTLPSQLQRQQLEPLSFHKAGAQTLLSSSPPGCGCSRGPSATQRHKRCICRF